jgi:outer membrane protein OmpA-like peptidoglycan-associated protein
MSLPRLSFLAIAIGLALLLGATPAGAQNNPLPSCPEDFGGVPRGHALTCVCRAASESTGEIWGTDIYTADSGVCTAARHAGLRGRSDAPITVISAPGRDSYAGSPRHGVTSSDYGRFEASFRVRAATPAEAQGVRICPDKFALYRGVDAPLRCLCPGEAAGGEATIWGSDVYTDDSGICRAAVHAGLIPASGGEVTLRALPGRSSYPAVTRNGVQSSAYEAWPGSFRFDGKPAASPSGAPVQAPVSDMLHARGQVQLYINFRTNSAELEPSATPVLQDLRAALAADAALRLALVGHTDSTGNAAQNRTLSQRRAESVRAWLVNQGIAAARLTVDGKGPDQPIADNATETGRALNRRVSATRLER